jgi:hypothetical protein
MFKDLVHVADRGFARLRNRAGSIIAGREFGDEKSVVEVKGWVRLCMRERGKIVPGSLREGKNVWTNTGREFLALLMSQQALYTPFRTDSIAYIGCGSGSQVASTSVLALANPIAADTGIFLAQLNIPPTFPLTPSRTTVQYSYTFLQTELTIPPSIVPVYISEIGLFTNGNQTNNFVPGPSPTGRDTSLANAALQSPAAYQTFEPVGKTNALEFEVDWQIRL